ncbi:Six-hairpin glycosidase [Laetiporus sulphureus 93-53]|uniref:Six-hairpin glycosidase n=1 Tax=Laetiporus sulphureus 93-53 TaxID=1314785 RepID=A0A165B2L6_9APHY|nr:Six-hairpin glycosidase [Laetiporus sulphureus 93-53]KZT00107.1 Six-hairpin glycosidase [Laetiporus sulphureus 93-53]
MPRPTTMMAALLVLTASALAQSLTSAQLDAVMDNLWLGAQQTWELGTEAEALTEYDAPDFSVFANASLPPSTSAVNYTALAPVLQIAYNTCANRTNATGAHPLIYVEGGAAGDPASIGVAVLLANRVDARAPPLNVPVSGGNGSTNGSGKGVSYAEAAKGQLEYTLEVVPRTSDGAISHRIEQVQLWSDSMYMVPPFLAYYGVMTGNQSIVQEAYTQIKLYRQYLYDEDASLWMHIVLGDNNHDPGFWSTGNGWAAAGMLRVLATVKHSDFADDMQDEMDDLKSWIEEIHDGMYKHFNWNTALFHNYANNTSTFLDASSTALLASTVYRFAALEGVDTYAAHAERSREALSTKGLYEAWGTGNGVGPATSFTPSATGVGASARASGSSAAWASYNVSASSFYAETTSYSHSSISSSSSSSSATSIKTSSYAASTPNAYVGTGQLHFSPEMWLAPVVDPYNWNVQGGSSPEGQAFVVEMYAAWRDWVDAGAPDDDADTVDKESGAGGAVWARAVGAGKVGVVGAVVAGVGLLMI